jgi:homoserine dehydrogenase
MEGSPVRIGLLGCGTVGGALRELIETQSDDVAARTGLRLAISRIVVRDPAKYVARGVPAELLGTDADALVADPDVDLVVEVIGGLEPARTLILDALKAGKPVVSGNKELLATAGPELFAAAEAAGVDLLFEAAVAGGIPLVRPLRESLLGEPIRRIMGIVNGTTNYILTRMTEAGVSYAAALEEAQTLGYAEADPTADVEGHDAGAKIAILASIAYGVRVGVADVHLEGISALTADDIAYATRKGLVVKLLAIAERARPAAGSGGAVGGDAIAVRVHPVLLARTHPLAAVRESFNAVFIEGSAVGELMFYGRGAGGHPSASAVFGDLIDAAANRRKGAHASLGALGRATIAPIDDLETEYFVSVDVSDRPGVLAAVAGVFGTHAVSISSMEQEGRGDEARLVFVTHRARERDVRATLAELHGLPAVRRVGSVIRVLGPEDRGGQEAS